MDDALAAALAADDAAEDAGMPADSRATCHTHRCWVDECATHPMHVNPILWAMSRGFFGRS